jgi:hypothetical protein
MKKRQGVVFIEVKDWDLDLYYTKNGYKYRKWFLKENNALLLSPFEQVDKYKDSLFSTYINNLNELKTHNNSYYGIVKTLVYFSTLYFSVQFLLGVIMIVDLINYKIFNRLSTEIIQKIYYATKNN